MKPDPDYKRLLKTIRHEEPDRVPLAELGVDRPIQSAFLGKPVNTMADEVEFWHKAGYDYIYQRANYEYCGLPLEVAAGTKMKFNSFGEERPESLSMMHKRGAIQNRDDFEKFPWPDPQTVDCTPLDELAELLPEGMGLITGVGGIFTRVWMLLGFTEAAIKIYEQPDMIEAMFNHIGEIQCQVLRRLIKKKRVFAIWYGDDLGYTESLIFPPDIFRKYLFPWLEEIATIAHNANMPLIMHSDGKLTEIIDDLIAIGIDALHPIEPKAMDIRELKRLYGHKLALFGNVDLNILGLGTPEET